MPQINVPQLEDPIEKLLRGARPEREPVFGGTVPTQPSTLESVYDFLKASLADPASNIGTIGGPALVRIPNKGLTVGKQAFQKQVEEMIQGRVPYDEATAGAGFTGHKLLYDKLPPITQTIPRTENIPLDVFTGLHPQRFQTHVQPNAQRFTAGALRGQPPPVKYLRGSSVHYKLPTELEKTHHPVAHSMSEELDVINPNWRAGEPADQLSVTPRALEVISEVQPETSVSQQGLQLTPKPQIEAELFEKVAPYSERFRAKPELVDQIAFYTKNLLNKDPRNVILLDDIQNALESGMLGDPNKVGDAAWWISYNANRGRIAEHPYHWNPLSMSSTDLGQHLPKRYTSADDFETLLRGFAQAYNIPLRNFDEVMSAVGIKPPPPPKSATQYDQIRLAEAMYNASRQDVLRRGNIPMFGRSGYTYTRGGGGSPFTDPQGNVRPQPGTIDMYEKIPEKMGMIPDVVRMESLPGTKFDANLQEWAQYMRPDRIAQDPSSINPIAKHIMEQGGYIEKYPGGGHTADLPIWLHPDEAKLLDEMGWRTPEKGRGNQLLEQIKDAERYGQWKETYRAQAGDPLVEEVIAKLNATPPGSMYSTYQELMGRWETEKLLRDTNAIRFNMTPAERLAVRNELQKTGSLHTKGGVWTPKDPNLAQTLHAYGKAYLKPTIQDYINSIKTGKLPESLEFLNVQQEILDLLAEENKFVKKGRNTLRAIVNPNYGGFIGTPAFRYKLAEQIAAGKHHMIVPQMEEIVKNRGGAELKRWLTANYPMTTASLKRPDFQLELKPGAEHIVAERTLDYEARGMQKKIHDVLTSRLGDDDAYWMGNAINRGRISEADQQLLGKHHQRIINILDTNPQYKELAGKVQSTVGATEWLKKLADHVRNYKTPAGLDPSVLGGGNP